LRQADWIRGVFGEARNRTGFGDGLFKGFLPFERAVKDPHPLKAYWTTRRSGKTTAALVGDVVMDQFDHPDELYAYIALTLQGAEGITRKMMEKSNREWNLGARFHESKYRWMFPNGAQIRLYGADKPGWINKLLGHEFRKVVIDEAAFYSIDIQQVIDDLKPTVLKGGGQIILCSNPGHFPKGAFFDITTEAIKEGKPPQCAHWMSQTKKRGLWSVHRWSVLDNPHMREFAKSEIEEQVATRPDVAKTSSFRRLWLGEWTTNPEDRVYSSYDLEHCRYPKEAYKTKKGDIFILGLDLGWFDHTGFAVLCYNKDREEIIVLESHRERKMDPVDVANRINMYMGYYPGLQIVGDPDHRQAFEQLRIRYELPIREAEKTSKLDWITLINEDFNMANVQIVNPESSPLSEELSDLTWVERPNGKMLENPKQSNDTCDGFLYAYKEAYHFRYKQAQSAPVPGTREHYAAIEAEIEKDLIERYDRSRDGDEEDW
jgi:hypothetical protein